MLSAPECSVGTKREGSSKLPTVRSMRGLSLNAKPSGVPHSRQKGRLAIGEEANQSGSRAQAMSVFPTFLKAIDTPPVARWHIRQWQR